MKFDSYDRLKEYTGKWVAESDLELLWQWVQKGMVTPEQVVKITRDCCCEEECMVNSLKQNAWKTFINNYNR